MRGSAYSPKNRKTTDPLVCIASQVRGYTDPHNQLLGAMANQDRWRLNPGDVHVSGSMSTSSRSRPTRRSHAAMGPSGATVELTHGPTGITVQGEIPLGRYTKRQLNTERRKLCERLYPELEKQVAQHLRIPGRST